MLKNRITAANRLTSPHAHTHQIGAQDQGGIPTSIHCKGSGAEASAGGRIRASLTHRCMAHKHCIHTSDIRTHPSHMLNAPTQWAAKMSLLWFSLATHRGRSKTTWYGRSRAADSVAQSNSATQLWAGGAASIITTVNKSRSTSLGPNRV